MEFSEIVRDKQKKPKEKTELLSQQLLDGSSRIDQLIIFAGTLKDTDKATCIEAIEYATKIRPEIADSNCLEFVSDSLAAKAPRIKWESARVIGNIAHLFTAKLDLAISNLLKNTKHPGTVVRWSTAFAIGQILKLKTSQNKELVPAIRKILDEEEKNSIKKIYIEALKKIGQPL